MNELLGILDNELNIYKEMLELSKQKTQIIVEGKVTELDKIVKVEQALVIQISKIEKKREAIFESASHEGGINKNNWNITELKKISTPEQGTRLEKYKESMSKMIPELTRVNQMNSKLITNSLDFIEFSLNLLSTADISSNNYGSKGDTLNKEKKNLFDIRL